MGVTILIPTYNEKENLGKLLEGIFLQRIANLSAIVVDDNSPDGTGKLAEEFAKKYPVKVIRRLRKMGLGTAYVDGFREVLKQNGVLGDILIQMDADLSHDPKIIPAMLERIKTHDLVLGSRYVAGGGIENWDFFRRMISKFGNTYAAVVLGLPYRDLTGGFKCWKCEALEKLDLDKLSSTGYNFQIETTYFAHKGRAKICEIPITFTERKFGASKFNLSIMLESFWKVLMLRFKR